MQKLLTYAHDAQNRMTFIEDVANGIACGCHCPVCGEALIAKNGGQLKEHHFAHASGSDCAGAYETALHQLSKDIICQEKVIMVPRYLAKSKNDDDYEPDLEEYEKIDAHQIRFEAVEAEQRNDAPDIQPDCVGITSDGLRLFIEICVTHAIDKAKRKKIRKGNFDCIEIIIPRNFPLDKARLTDLICHQQESRKWIHFPYGENVLAEKKERLQKENIIKYREEHCAEGYRGIRSEKCQQCIYHKQQMALRYQEFIDSYKGKLLWWAGPIAKLPPETILKQEICIEHKYNHAAYVRYNHHYKYIYPKDNDFESPEHERVCNATYRFFKELYSRCEWYVNHLDNMFCEHFGKSFEYDGQWYVFCKKPK